MSELREWAAGLCTAGIGCALLQLLCPTGAWQRLFKTLTAVFFFCALLSPLPSLPSAVSGLLSSFGEQTEVSVTLTSVSEEQLVTLIARQAEAQVKAILEPQGIEVKKVEAKRDSSHEDGIYIECILITVDKPHFPLSAAVCATLSQALGAEVEVVYDG